MAVLKLVSEVHNAMRYLVAYFIDMSVYVLQVGVGVLGLEILFLLFLCSNPR